jgi:NADH dehydrogenase
MTVRAPADTLVTIFGGSGFLGRHVVRALAKRDYRIRVAVRRPELAGHLQPLGRVGQINAVQANLRFPASVQAAMRGSTLAINLVGILSERRRQTFDAVQTIGAGTVAHAAAEHAAQFIHVSAIGADEQSPSHYARSKALGERQVLAARPGATIVRPSIMFGPEDDFFNRFGSLARFAPALPLIGGGRTALQPVFVGDVAAAIAELVDGKLIHDHPRAGEIYEFGGPDIRSFKELMEYTLATIERHRLLVSLPFAIAKLQASVLQFLPKPPLTPDQVELLRSDNIVSEQAVRDQRTLDGLGITPTSIQAVVPSYLWRFRKTGQFRDRVA